MSEALDFLTTRDLPVANRPVMARRYGVPAVGRDGDCLDPGMCVARERPNFARLALGGRGRSLDFYRVGSRGRR